MHRCRGTSRKPRGNGSTTFRKVHFVTRSHLMTSKPQLLRPRLDPSSDLESPGNWPPISCLETSSRPPHSWQREEGLPKPPPPPPPPHPGPSQSPNWQTKLPCLHLPALAAVFLVRETGWICRQSCRTSPLRERGWICRQSCRTFPLCQTVSARPPATCAKSAGRSVASSAKWRES